VLPRIEIEGIGTSGQGGAGLSFDLGLPVRADVFDLIPDSMVDELGESEGLSDALGFGSVEVMALDAVNVGREGSGEVGTAGSVGPVPQVVAGPARAPAIAVPVGGGQVARGLAGKPPCPSHPSGALCSRGVDLGHGAFCPVVSFPSYLVGRVAEEELLGKLKCSSQAGFLGPDEDFQF
jgi:hypothetical protein